MLAKNKSIKKQNFKRLVKTLHATNKYIYKITDCATCLELNLYLYLTLTLTHHVVKCSFTFHMYKKRSKLIN